MIDPNYIHQRDVSTILTNLQNDVNNVRERYAENPNDPQLAIELQTLIDNADRDLRLKTQAIVRARLSQSRLLPIQSKSIPAPELPPRSHSVAGTGPPLPPLQPAPSDYEPTNPHKRSMINKNQPPQPIQPIVHEKHSKVLAAHNNKEKYGRTRRIPLQKETLPRIDKHDPLAPPPPISEKLINTYGLEQLNESGLIQNHDIKKHLEGIVTVAPFTYELPPVPLSVTPNYVLDTSNETNNVIQIKPNSREKPSTPVEEINNQEESKNAKLNKSHSLDSDEKDEKTMIFTLINGIPDEDSIGYINFRQLSFNISETIDIYMGLFCRLCEANGLKEQKIDGQKLIELASCYDPDEVSEERLFGCFAGNSKKIKKGGRFGFGFIGPGAERKAAVAIQSIWRGFVARRFVKFIKRSSSAAKKIQIWYKHKNDIHKFNQSMKNAKRERQRLFLKLQKTDFYHPNQPHLLLHIIDGHLPSELGRIQALKTNKNSTLAIFSRFPLPTVIASYLKDHVEDQEKLIFVIPKQKLPYTLPIEDVLASDLRLMKQIQEIADERPIYLIPNRMRDSLVDVGSYMKSYILAPLPSSLRKVQGLKNNREFLSIGCKNLFAASQDEIFNKEDLCANLASLSLSNLMTDQWLIRSNSGGFAWIDTNEIPILAKMRKNAKILTQSDLDDPTFRSLLIKNISDNLNTIANTISTTNKNDFLKDACSKGAVIQAAPQKVKSMTSVSLFVTARRKNNEQKSSSCIETKETEKKTNDTKENQNENETNITDSNCKVQNEENKTNTNEKDQQQPEQQEQQQEQEQHTQEQQEQRHEHEEEDDDDDDDDEFVGDVHITGTWENLYISEFERFATIHPAFIVKPERIRKHTMKYADELIKRNLIGTSVIDFWSSERDDKNRLTPHNIEFIATERSLPQNLAENVCNLSFNEKHLKMGRYTYVQERLVLPQEISISELNKKCSKNGIKVNKNVFFLPDLQEEITVGFVAVADTAELLINLVYETFCILSEKVFDLQNDPHALLFTYCTAIEYLKDQIDSESGITSTVFMKKLNVKVVEDQVQPLLFHFEDLKKQNDDQNDDIFESVETPKFVDDQKIAENTSDAKNSAVKIVSDDYVPEGRRSLITTPVDANGRERRLITCEEENLELLNKKLKTVKEDLPDAPAGANISDEPSDSNVDNSQIDNQNENEIKNQNENQDEIVDKNQDENDDNEDKNQDDKNDGDENDDNGKIEGNDDEILTEEAETPRSDDED